MLAVVLVAAFATFAFFAFAFSLASFALAFIVAIVVAIDFFTLYLCALAWARPLVALLTLGSKALVVPGFSVAADASMRARPARKLGFVIHGAVVTGK